MRAVHFLEKCIVSHMPSQPPEHPSQTHMAQSRIAEPEQCSIHVVIYVSQEEQKDIASRRSRTSDLVIIPSSAVRFVILKDTSSALHMSLRRPLFALCTRIAHCRTSFVTSIEAIPDAPSGQWVFLISISSQVREVGIHQMTRVNFDHVYALYQQ